MSSKADRAFQKYLSDLENTIKNARFQDLYLPDAPIPSPDQIKILRFFVHCVRSLMQVINQDPRSKLPAYERQVKHACKEGNKYIAEHERLAAPLRRIPLGVMRKIFIYVSQYSTRVLHEDSRIAFNPFELGCVPWEVTQVCHAWREVAHGTQALWRNLPPIDLDKKYTEEAGYIDFLTTLLLRSGTFPISFLLRGKNFTSVSHQVTKLLASHAVRWERVILVIPLKGFRALEDARGRLDNLTTLSINWAECRRRDCEGTHDLFSYAPLLEYVRIQGEPVGEIVVPHRFLKDLRLKGGKMDVGGVLSSTRLANLCMVDVVGDDESIVNPQLRTEMSDLISLRIHRADGVSLVEPLLKALVAPRLSDLEISLDSSSKVILPAVFSMLRRSAPNTSCLTHLYLNCWFEKLGEFHHLLRVLPLLTHLKISLPFPQDVIHLSSSTSEDENLWLLAPSLEVCAFTVGDNTTTTVSDDVIKAITCLARARCDLREVIQFINTVIKAGSPRPPPVTWEKKSKEDTRTPLRALYICAPGSEIEALQTRFTNIFEEFAEGDDKQHNDKIEVAGVEKNVRKRIQKHYESQGQRVDFEKTHCSIVYLPKSNGKPDSL
ncbi:hypothetical protein CPB84DRAFT_1751469 [Gymnopilus junonius]|uniref:F-box domain-containing protein n=1 Tax=Gymnopilus junonius TaxID=109634 RepID=A0A9P5TIS9_GYMJU|nr:hypothetical protein CPB84DRAFT_1751469 [Gymnopilus junonius]